MMESKRARATIVAGRAHVLVGAKLAPTSLSGEDSVFSSAPRCTRRAPLYPAAAYRNGRSLFVSLRTLLQF